MIRSVVVERGTDSLVTYQEYVFSQMKPSYLKRSVPLLPPEVWSCIFHHATHVPGALIPDIYAYAHLVGPDYNRTFHPRLREALITKRTLVRVCKQWWHLATPYLYRSLYISQVHGLLSLFITLLHSAAGKRAIAGTRPLGEYTQRLDIAIHDQSMDVSAEFGWLAAIIKYSPNLAIISFGIMTNFGGRDLPRDMVYALHDIAPTLRVFDWSSPDLGLSAAQMTGLIPKCTQLRVLNCPWLVWSRELEHGGIPPTLTTLHVQIIMPVQVATDLFDFDPNAARRPGPTALQELILDINYHSKELLHLYGSQLVSVHLRVDLPSNVDADMELLAQTCPGLRRLTITSEHFSSFIRPNLVFPSITYLGLRTTRHQSTRQDFKTLFMLLEELRSSVPSLRVVQLLNEHNICCLFRSHVKLVKRALQPLMEAAPFRVEDKEGVLLTDRLRALGHL